MPEFIPEKVKALYRTTKVIARLVGLLKDLSPTIQSMFNERQLAIDLQFLGQLIEDTKGVGITIEADDERTIKSAEEWAKHCTNMGKAFTESISHIVDSNYYASYGTATASELSRTTMEDAINIVKKFHEDNPRKYLQGDNMTERMKSYLRVMQAYENMHSICRDHPLVQTCIDGKQLQQDFMVLKELVVEADECEKPRDISYIERLTNAEHRLDRLENQLLTVVNVETPKETTTPISNNECEVRAKLRLAIDEFANDGKVSDFVVLPYACIVHATHISISGWSYDGYVITNIATYTPGTIAVTVTRQDNLDKK